jgi:amino acid adenylation domain-containing protein
MLRASDNLALPLHLNSLAGPERTAIVADRRELSYGEAAALARRLAGQFQSVRRTGRVGILASRSVAACAGILGTAWSGGTYVPLNLKLPEERLLYLLGVLDLDALVVDARGAKLITPAVAAASPRTILCADEARGIEAVAPHAVRLSDVGGDGPAAPAPVAPDDVAYIEFTSGTTGIPKGVMVPVGAVNQYLRVSQEKFGLSPDDRMAETCDITFDLSVHNMFLAWNAGAALHVMSPLEMVSPSRFIRDRRITAWLSVPSIIAMMRKTRALEPGSLPSLRLSWFCGEALPVGAARAWAAAAPNSHVENIYGPTEATVACLWQQATEPIVVTPSREIVAIGLPYPGMEAAIFDDKLRPVPAGTPGEIALSGAQLAHGYFGQPELTEARFPTIDGKRWYLTGDLGAQDEQGLFHHLGRIDNQVKVLGNRIELEEVEMHLRAASGSDHVAAVAWPMRDGLAEGIVGFVVGDRAAEEILAAMRSSVVAYMVPNAIHIVDALPLNGNGKTDRKALAAMLDGEALTKAA